MKKTILKSLVIVLLTGLAGGAALSVRAEEPATTSAPKTTKQQLAGKVVAVDKKSRTVTMEVNGKTYVLQLDKKTKIAKAGKKDENGQAVPGAEQTFDDIGVGESLEVGVAVTELPSGEVQVAVETVQTDLPEDAAGKGHAHGHDKGKRNGPPVPFPGNGTPNLGNSGGNVVSPN